MIWDSWYILQCTQHTYMSNCKYLTSYSIRCFQKYAILVEPSLSIFQLPETIFFASWCRANATAYKPVAYVMMMHQKLFVRTHASISTYTAVAWLKKLADLNWPGFQSKKSHLHTHYSFTSLPGVWLSSLALHIVFQLIIVYKSTLLKLQGDAL